MAKGKVVAGLNEEQYAEIELAVMESNRGRAFLKEFLAQNRNSDTMMLLDAISRLESALCLKTIEHETGSDPSPALAEIAAVVTATRTEIAAIRNDLIEDGGILPAGTDAFNAAAERANSLSAKFLTQAESVEDLAWKIRELGADSEVCDKLDACVEELMSLCWQEDVNGQRAAKALNVLQFVNDRTGGSLVTTLTGETSEQIMATDQAALPVPGQIVDEARSDANSSYFADDAYLFSETPVTEKPAAPVEAPQPAPEQNEPIVEMQSQAPSFDGNTYAPETPSPEVAAEEVQPQEAEIAPLPAEVAPETAEASAPAELQAPSVPEFDDPFQQELAQFKQAGNAETPVQAPEAEVQEPVSEPADPVAEVEAETQPAEEDTDDGNGHIVIIRTPSEPEVDRVLDPVTQDKPDDLAEVPFVTITAPASNTA